MKVTKQVLVEMRHCVAEPQGFSAQRGDLAELPVGLLQTLLDERKALREALGDLVEWVEGMPDEALRAAEIRSALALGEDE